jgi:hypothetical protein
LVGQIGFGEEEQEGGSSFQEVHSGLGIFKMAAVAMETVNVCQNL